MTSTKHHVYRTTTDKLAEAMDDIVADGGTILQAAFAGGRDWVVLWCKGTGLRQVPVTLRRIDPSELGPGLVPSSGLQQTIDRIAADLARIRRDVEHGATMGARSRAGR